MHFPRNLLTHVYSCCPAWSLNNNLLKRELRCLWHLEVGKYRGRRTPERRGDASYICELTLNGQAYVAIMLAGEASRGAESKRRHQRFSEKVSLSVLNDRPSRISNRQGAFPVDGLKEKRSCRSGPSERSVQKADDGACWCQSWLSLDGGTYSKVAFGSTSIDLVDSVS